MAVGDILGGHRVRVNVRWLASGSLWPTWYAVRQTYATWADVRAANPTWADLLANTNLTAGKEKVEDITCDVAGLDIRRGRQSGSEHPQAATMDLTLLDPGDGHYDPRWSPGGPSRLGALIEVFITPAGGTEVPLFSGFVESWELEKRAEGAPLVNVTCSDALHFMARSHPEVLLTPVGAGETAAERVERLLRAIPWSAVWGTTDVETTAGAITCNPTQLTGNRTDTDEIGRRESASVIDQLHMLARSEDALLDVTPDGTLRWRNDGWRDRLGRGIQAIVDLDGTEPDGPLPILCPSDAPIGVDDLDIATEVEVTRSTDFDPTNAAGERPEEVRKRAVDVQAKDRYGPIEPFNLHSLPHRGDARSQVLADRWIHRLAHEPAPVADITLQPSKRPQEGVVLANMDTALDSVWVTGAVLGLRRIDAYEVIAVEHRITAEGPWEAMIRVDRWFGALPAPTPTGEFDTAEFDHGDFDTAWV